MSQVTAAIPKEVSRHTIGHHFNNAEQEFSAAKFGFWIFLCTELLMFGGLFVAYIYLRVFNPEMMFEAHKTLSIPLGTLNTVVLITSSFTMAMAIRSAMVNQLANVRRYLWATLLLAVGFLFIKFAFEWPSKFEHGTLPAKWYTYEGLSHVTDPQIFFGMYFVTTGLHAIHILIGIGLIIWLIKLANKNKFYSGYYTPLEITGLYWHFVDLIWIFVFPLYYLVG